MILSNLRLTNRAHQVRLYSGIDSREHCLDPKHFGSYADAIDYRYNSRGFRDREWPQSFDHMRQCIWCVGDSFTVGIGQPLDNIWPNVLEQTLGQRTINFSMDGASNNWIARRTKEICESVDPQHVIVMWSYVERREHYQQDLADAAWQKIYDNIRDPSWPLCPTISDIAQLPANILKEITAVHGIQFPLQFDDLMIVQDSRANHEENFANWCACVDQLSGYDNITHAVIPKFADPTDCGDTYWDYLATRVTKCIKRYQQLDWARDGHHFDILTARHLVDQLIPLIQPKTVARV